MEKGKQEDMEIMSHWLWNSFHICLLTANKFTLLNYYLNGFFISWAKRNQQQTHLFVCVCGVCACAHIHMYVQVGQQKEISWGGKH